MSRHYYTGKRGDKYCGLCGKEIRVVKCNTGVYSTKTGKMLVDTLVVCVNRACYGKAPDDLWLVGGEKLYV